MKTLLLYRPNSPDERRALDYQRDFTGYTGKTLSTLDPDTREGAETCRLYDIVQFPTILVTDNDGRMQNLWVAEQLPTFSELSYYVEDKPAPEPVPHLLNPTPELKASTHKKDVS